MATVNEQLLDRMVRHQIALSRLASQTNVDLSSLLERDNPRIIRVLEGISSNTSVSELEAALKSIQRVNQISFDSVQVAFIGAMVALANYEIEFQSRVINEVLGQLVINQLSFERPSTQQLSKVVTSYPIDGAKLNEYIQGAANGRYTRIRDTIRREYSKGGNSVTGAIASAILGTSTSQYADGVFGLGLRSLEQIVRTVQNGIVSASRDLLYTSNNPMFSGVLWVSVLDTKTSDICQHLDGKVFSIQQGPRPPAHRGCRSTTSHIVRSWDELKLSNLSESAKSELNGQVPERITYAQWLRRQPAAVQDEVLGPTRGRMYRRGEVTFDRFVDKKGNRYTLDELRKREGL